ncbi:hypothetical protein L2E82_30759 [Cichorium intybus]|uniref:Uncharacterized protein n=1 Tax=Cichorium intybus TaxID=13427 RepID=A0ACB9D1H3_CICIN|nr:hypothetical protein L2E82_30759 [Cichorium intybus]
MNMTIFFEASILVLCGRMRARVATIWSVASRRSIAGCRCAFCRVSASSLVCRAFRRVYFWSRCFWSRREGWCVGSLAIRKLVVSRWSFAMESSRRDHPCCRVASAVAIWSSVFVSSSRRDHYVCRVVIAVAV